MDKGGLAFSGFNRHKAAIAGLALVTDDGKELTLRLMHANDIQYSGTNNSTSKTCAKGMAVGQFRGLPVEQTAPVVAASQ